MISSPSPLKLLVGLGNPGEHYAATRHNAGRWFLSMVAAHARASFTPAPIGSGHQALVSDCRLFLPNNPMNNVGPEIKRLIDFYKIAPEEILISHDEADFAPGILRLRWGGNPAGHNGVASVQKSVTKNFWRLRVGVGRAEPLSDYLLTPPPPEEQELISAAQRRGCRHWPAFVAGQWDYLMNILHRKNNNC